MVKVFSKKNCGNCKKAKFLFKVSKIDFQEIDVEQDEKALAYVKDELGFSSLPIIVADGFSPFEYNQDKLKDFVKSYNG